jgi:hypothetical protein
MTGWGKCCLHELVAASQVGMLLLVADDRVKQLGVSGSCQQRCVQECRLQKLVAG